MRQALQLGRQEVIRQAMGDVEQDGDPEHLLNQRRWRI
jgi:hypothetical protein